MAVDLTKHLASLPAPDWGFNGLGEIVYLRTYSRFIEAEGRGENPIVLRTNGMTPPRRSHPRSSAATAGAFRSIHASATPGPATVEPSGPATTTRSLSPSRVIAIARSGASCW